MTENQKTTNLELPYIMASQAQKHVTHNEALKKLDAIVHLAVISRTEIPDTALLEDGSRFIVPDGSGGELSGMGGKIAVFTNQVWEFYSPNEGWLCFVQDQESLWVFSSGDWREVTQGAFTDTFERLGINASADDFNRLTVNAEATLLNHDGAGHQLKINKESEADTASCVFQSGFSGRAELGLVQSDNLVLRTSVDGAVWNTALEIDNATLSVGLGGQEPTANFGLAVDHGIKISSGDRLHNLFQSEGSFQITSMENFSSAQAWHGNFLMAKRSRGTVSQPETVQNGDLVFLLDIYSHDGQDFHRTAQQRFFVEGEPQEAAIPMGYDFRLTDQEGILHSRTRILPNGDVGIGEYAPSTKLHVDGPVRVKSYSQTELPSASDHGAGSMIFVPNEDAGPCMAFSDGALWRRMDTSSVI